MDHYSVYMGCETVPLVSGRNHFKKSSVEITRSAAF